MITASKMYDIYSEAFSDEPVGLKLSRAPGRVNLIGGHTDYNDGYVLPIPINRYLWIVAKPRQDNAVNLFAADYSEETSFQIDAPVFDEEHLWANYLLGVADVMRKRGYSLSGANMVIKGDIPQGAGLASSAALEVAAGRAFMKLFNLEIDPVDLAYIGKSAENDFVGVECGVMDQFVSALGKPDQALFIDCRTNDYITIPLHPKYCVIIVNTTIKRELTSSAYNQRKRQCGEGVNILRSRLPGIKALRDVSKEDFKKYQTDLPKLIRMRCKHVISENDRVLGGVEALKNQDYEKVGSLMYESHNSLKDDYGVSCWELDVLVEATKDMPGVIGSRMTGAGFGGSTVNIVSNEYAEDFTRNIKKEYQETTGIQAEVYKV